MIALVEYLPRSVKKRALALRLPVNERAMHASRPPMRRMRRGRLSTRFWLVCWW